MERQRYKFSKHFIFTLTSFLLFLPAKFEREKINSNQQRPRQSGASSEKIWKCATQELRPFSFFIIYSLSSITFIYAYLSFLLSSLILRWEHDLLSFLLWSSVSLFLTFASLPFASFSHDWLFRLPPALLLLLLLFLLGLLISPQFVLPTFTSMYILRISLWVCHGGRAF